MAAKQYQPLLVGVKEADVAVAVSPAPAVRLTGEPTAVPADVHTLEPVGWLLSGPQTEKATVPVGSPCVALPVTTALSVLLWPKVMLVWAGVVLVVVVVDVGVPEQSMPPDGTVAEAWSGEIDTLATVAKGTQVPGPPIRSVKSDADAEAWVPSALVDWLVIAPMEMVPTPKGRSRDGLAASRIPRVFPQNPLTDRTGALNCTVAPPAWPVAATVSVGAATTPTVIWKIEPPKRVTLVNCEEAVERSPSLVEEDPAVSSTCELLETVGFSEISEPTPGRKPLTAEA